MPRRACAAAALLACLHEGANAISLQREAASSFPAFEAFVQTHGRSYSRSEYEQRQKLYQKHVAEATEQNAKTKRSWTARVNEYYDWSDEELMTLSGQRSTAAQKQAKLAAAAAHRPAFLQKSKARRDAEDLPASASWTNISSLQHIRKQGACGSCWAVAAVTVLESHAEIHTGKRRTFAAQQIVSCMPNPQECGGQGGCRGATAGMAFEWVLQHGCAEENAMPYQAKDIPCNLQTSGSPTQSLLGMKAMLDDDMDDMAPAVNLGGSAFGMTGWHQLSENNYEDLMRAVATQGPVAVSVAANGGWHHYGFGVFDSCDKDAIMNHAVVMTGYGVDGDQKYWQIQNSWGRDWGEDGRMRLLRHDDEGEWCGTDDKPELGSACKPYPDAVKVCGTCGILYDSVVPHFQAV